MVEGYIHSTESLGTRDGPGIRFVVFMQGCPLRCKYCHNPDTWKLHQGKKVNVEQLIQNIIRCKPYIDRSGGGVTISGGEPTMQLDFTLELLKKCKEEGLHTAVDTSGYIQTDKFRRLIPYLDLVLLDIKQMDNEKHKELTGVSNEKTLKIIELLEKEKQSYWIRYVVVPGHTDDKDDLIKLAQYLSGKEYMEKLELLPYHNLGEHKWQELNIKYQLKEVEPPSDEKVKKVEDIFKKYTQ
ncbi:MAG: pyruvate formate-lyase-activating protein [Halothermotrichaceae bacterium]